MELTLVLILALVLDELFGETKRFHPLVGFGYLAGALERRLNLSSRLAIELKLFGVFSWLALVTPAIAGYYCLSLYAPWWLDAIVLYLAIGNRSLREHANQVYKPLHDNNIELARFYCGYLVSRETNQLMEPEVSRAVVESVLENGHDAVIASLFWYCIGGVPLVIAHRLANTLDAMWGYKNSRFINFGWFSAKIDDLLGWPSAKVTALLYSIQGANPLQCMKNGCIQSKGYKSLNGGWVMAAGASALFIKLGGTATYFGQSSQSVALGQGNKVTAADIPASTELVMKASYWFVAFVFVFELIM